MYAAPRSRLTRDEPFIEVGFTIEMPLTMASRETHCSSCGRRAFSEHLMQPLLTHIQQCVDLSTAEIAWFNVRHHEGLFHCGQG